MVLQRFGFVSVAGTSRWNDGLFFWRPLGAVLSSSSVSGARSGDSTLCCRSGLYGKDSVRALRYAAGKTDFVDSYVSVSYPLLVIVTEEYLV